MTITWHKAIGYTCKFIKNGGSKKAKKILTSLKSSKYLVNLKQNFLKVRERERKTS